MKDEQPKIHKDNTGIWQEVLRPNEVMGLSPDTRIRINHRETTIGEYEGFCLPGGFPLLAGFVALGLFIELEIKDE